jgi:hypothetical protein
MSDNNGERLADPFKYKSRRLLSRGLKTGLMRGLATTTYCTRVRFLASALVVANELTMFPMFGRYASYYKLETLCLGNRFGIREK